MAAIDGLKMSLHDHDLMITVLIEVLDLHLGLEFVQGHSHLRMGANVGLSVDVPINGNVRNREPGLLTQNHLRRLAFDDILVRIMDFPAIGRGNFHILVLHGNLGRHDRLLVLARHSLSVHHVVVMN